MKFLPVCHLFVCLTIHVGCEIDSPIAGARQTVQCMQFIYTPQQLAKHDANSKSIWVGIAGEVYDVSKARKFYGAL